MRGWTLDVLNLVRSLHKQNFSLADAYALEPHLASLHPANRHVRDKIRQACSVPNTSSIAARRDFTAVARSACRISEIARVRRLPAVAVA
ncbi:MAG: hypothetical protein ACYDBL_04615, partial [Candidatus Acidiferrales bacterium]